jgi:hypothetical protein
VHNLDPAMIVVFHRDFQNVEEGLKEEIVRK